MYLDEPPTPKVEFSFKGVWAKTKRFEATTKVKLRAHFSKNKFISSSTDRYSVNPLYAKKPGSTSEQLYQHSDFNWDNALNFKGWLEGFLEDKKTLGKRDIEKIKEKVKAI